MTNENQLRVLYLANNEIKEIQLASLSKADRKQWVRQLRKQGVHAIFATEKAPVYEAGVRREIFICHTLGYFKPGSICLHDVPSVQQRKEMYTELLRSLCTLLMEHGGIVLSMHDDEPDECDDDEEDSFAEYTVVECEFPTQADAETATQGILDTLGCFGVAIFNESGQLIEGGDRPSSSLNFELPNTARTNKSPQQRVPSRLVRAYANLSGEREDALAQMRSCNEAEDEAAVRKRLLSIEVWCRKRDLLYNMARLAWLEAGLSFDPTIEQLDKWLGGHRLYAVRP